ncbi:MAG: transposase, partial [Proteobacteria bacterium]|nr:transposase [Pseudomonadota bacterium]
MTDCTPLSFDFPACRKRRVEVDFSGGDITSSGGVLLLRQADRLTGLTASLARRLTDARQRGKVAHGFAAMLRQRVFALALGYEVLVEGFIASHPEPPEELIPRVIETDSWPMLRAAPSRAL